MTESTYRVLDRGKIIAAQMTLETALILVSAMAKEYWKDPQFEITMQREEERRK